MRRRFVLPDSSISISRPGVAMTISTPRCRSRIWGPFGAPPYMAVLRMRELELLRRSTHCNSAQKDEPRLTRIWCTPAVFVQPAHGWGRGSRRSDRHRVRGVVACRWIGQRSHAAFEETYALMCNIAGRAKAIVLPLPVCAIATTS